MAHGALRSRFCGSVELSDRGIKDIRKLVKDFGIIDEIVEPSRKESAK